MTSQFRTAWLAFYFFACSDAGSQGFTRLMRASASGADPDDADSKGTTALSLAAQFGRADVAALLLRSGAEVDLADADGVTPLMKAARFGHEETLDELLRAGADRSRRDNDGRDAAAWARSSGHEALARHLEP